VVNYMPDHKHTYTSTRDVLQAVVTYYTNTASVVTAGRILCNIPNTNTTQLRFRSFLLDNIKSYKSSYYGVFVTASRSQWPRRLKGVSSAARSLGVVVSNVAGCMVVCLL
jgi:hypothetical protein